MILELLKLWMSSKAPPMDMEPPLPCPMTPTTPSGPYNLQHFFLRLGEILVRSM